MVEIVVCSGFPLVHAHPGFLTCLITRPLLFSGTSGFWDFYSCYLRISHLLGTACIYHKTVRMKQAIPNPMGLNRRMRVDSRRTDTLKARDDRYENFYLLYRNPDIYMLSSSRL